MIIRISIFLTLLATFYFYCQEDNDSQQYRSPNDINMLEVPRNISPVFIEDEPTAYQILPDSLTDDKYELKTINQ